MKRKKTGHFFMDLGLSEHILFWVLQILAVIGIVIKYARTQQTDRRQFNLYHTYLCIPLFCYWVLLGAWLMASLCFVGAFRTLILATDWGWARKRAVVLVCLSIPVGGAVFTASQPTDWILIIFTIYGVGADAFKSFLNLRIASFFCSLAWFLNGLAFGGYLYAFGEFISLIGNLKVMHRDFAIMTRMRAVLGCEKSKAACLAMAS